MGKEQDLLQAVKNGDLMSTQKLLSKLKNNRNSEYSPYKHFYSEILVCLWHYSKKRKSITCAHASKIFL